MKVAILLLLCLSCAVALAEEHDIVETEEVDVSRKLLDYKKPALKFCDPYDGVITCKGYGEFCKKLSYPICKKIKKCDKKEKYCAKYGYKYVVKGHYKKKVKYCVKYDYKVKCYYDKVCYKYACAKRVFKKKHG